MNDDGLRLSDAERDAAAVDLGEHFAQGRLTAEEHDERLGAIWSAKTRGELPGLFADLPSRYAQVVAPARSTPAAPAYAPRPGGPRSVLRRLPPPLRVVLAVLLAILVISHLPLILLAGVIWIVISRSQGRPAFRRSHGHGYGHSHGYGHWR